MEEKLRRKAQYRTDFLTGLAAFLITLPVYVMTLAPDVGAGHDTGELTVCAVTQGVPHAPGYPLYVMLGYLFNSVFAIGEPSWRMNLYAAVCMAIGVGFVAAAMTRATRPLPGLSAALMYGFATAVWRQAVAAEVFSLHLAMLAALIYLALAWRDEDDPGRGPVVLWAAFILGLELAHHHTVLMAGPGLLAFGLLAKGRGRAWGFSWATPVVLAISVVIPYGFMLYLSQQMPTYNWGDPSDFEGLMFHILRKAYGTGLLNEAATELSGQAGELQAVTLGVTLIRNQFPFPLILLALLGFDQALRPGKRTTGLLFGWMTLMYGPLFALMGNQPPAAFFADLMERFYASSFIGLAGFLALGCQALGDRLAAYGPRWPALLLALPLYSLGMNYSKADQRGQYHGVDFMTAMYDSLPQGSLLFVEGDLTAGVSDYLRVVRRYRPDLLILLPGLIGTEWYQKMMLTFRPEWDIARRAEQNHNAVQEAIMRYRFETNGQVWLNYIPEDKGKQLIPGKYIRHGIVWQWFPVGAKTPSDAESLATSERMLDILEKQPKRGHYQENWKQNFWTRWFISEWVYAYRALADDLSKTDPARALLALERSLAYSERPRFRDLVNAALLALDAHQPQRAKELLEKALEQFPDNVLAVASMVAACRALQQEDEAKAWYQRLQELRAKE